MLNIPAAVQTLFKTDGVPKQFRVHFPNGERPDLTNSDIVNGTVKFTESVCSKDVLQFGLAEASQIEFECVGVENIYGYTIQCAIEIKIGNEIQNDPDIDNTLDWLTTQYVVYSGIKYYRVPYGEFTVTSCPRSAGAMWKRRVQGTEGDGTAQIAIPSFLKNKYNCYFYQGGVEALIQNVPLIMADITQNIDDLNTTQTEWTIDTNGHITPEQIMWEYQGVTVTFRVIEGAPYKDGIAPIHSVNDSVFKITCDIDYDVVDPVMAKVAELGAPKSIYDYILALLTYGFHANIGFESARGMFPLENPENTDYFYPYVNGLTNGFGIYVHVGAISEVEIYAPDPENPDAPYLPYVFQVGDTVSNFHIYRYQASNSILLNENISLSSSGKGYYSTNTYFGSLDLTKLIESYAELNAQFRKDDRTGNAEYITLSKSSPISVDTDEYRELWWDEYDIAPIGSIQLTYKDIDLNKEQTVIYEFGNGASQYDMTDNYLLKNLAVKAEDITQDPQEQTAVENYVKTLLDTYFIPNIQDIAFTPVDLEALGLPYLEAGDYIEIDDGNEGTVGTYIMSRTLSGVHSLEDEIESQGGEIIGSDVRSI